MKKEPDRLLSLIICTYKRDQELSLVLRSLGSIPTNVEIVIVDQNAEPCELGEERDKVDKIIRKRLGSLSEARRVGLQVASGTFVGIPDDDNYYSEGYLDVVLRVLQKYKDEELMVGLVTNWKAFDRFPRSGKLSHWNSLRFGNSGTTIFRREPLLRMKDFGLAMDMSPGTRFPAGDETVLISNVLAERKRRYYIGVADAYIDHPVFPMTKEREYTYGIGMGGLAGKLILKGWCPGLRLALRLLFGPIGLLISALIARDREKTGIAMTKIVRRWKGALMMISTKVAS